MNHPNNHPQPPRESLLDEERRHSRENAESLRRIATALDLIAHIAQEAAGHGTPPPRSKTGHHRRHEVQL